MQLKAPSGLVTYVEPIANYQSYGVPQNYELGYNYNHINPKTATSQRTQTRTSSSTTRQYSPPTGSNRSGAQTTYQPLNSGAQPKNRQTYQTIEGISSPYYQSGAQPTQLASSSTNRSSPSSTTGTRPYTGTTSTQPQSQNASGEKIATKIASDTSTQQPSGVTVVNRCG